MAGIIKSMYIEPHTRPVIPLSGNLFEDAYVNTEFKLKQRQKVMCDSTLPCHEKGTLKFKIPASPLGQLTMTDGIELHVKVLVKKKLADGTLVDLPIGTGGVAYINNVGHSLFSNMQMHFEKYLVTPRYENYAYMAYMTNVLSRDSAAKSSTMTNQGWATDTSTEFNSTIDNMG